jgi:hypothetical protein
VCFAAAEGCWGKQSPTQLNAAWAVDSATRKGCVLDFSDAEQLGAFKEALSLTRPASAQPVVGKKRDMENVAPAPAAPPVLLPPPPLRPSCCR